MTYQNALVTGAGRGIGLEFVRQLLDLKPAPKNVIAAFYESTKELSELQSKHTILHSLKYDATDYDSLEEFTRQVKAIVAEDGLDLLVNNAGIHIRDTIETINQKDLLRYIEVNAVGPLMLTKSLLPILKTAAVSRKTVIANLSSLKGSLADNKKGGEYAYRASKTAQNMFAKCLAVDLAPSKIIILQLHPGWVQGAMTGMNPAALTPLTSVTGLMEVIEKSDPSQSGAFINYAGKVLPW